MANQSAESIYWTFYQIWRVFTLPLAACDNLLRSRRIIITGQPRWKMKTLFCISLVALTPYLYIQLTFPVRYIFKHSNTSTACVIPHPDPFDPSILKFVWHPDPLVCDVAQLPVIYVDDYGLLQFNQSALHVLNLDYSKIDCKYSILNRHLDDDHVIFSDPVHFSSPIRVDADFIKVTCLDQKKTLLFERILTNIRKTVNRAGSKILDESRDQLSVIVFGIDSVSRSGAIRKLPKTFKYLTENLQSYDFKGHMKVGENTLPNLIPFLTGRRVWTDEVPIHDYSTEPFDSFPLIWKNFSSRGYATFYAEDSPTFGTFNYLTKGFIHPPTDHYMRPFYLGLEEEKGRISNEVQMFLENQKIKVKKGSTFCYGDKPLHEIQTEYLKQFIRHYSKKRKFALSFLNELSHEYPNFLEYGDEMILDLLKWMKSNGHLENSAFILFSDHGARIDKIRNTFVGRIEDRMPVFELVLPEHVKSRFPDLHDNLLKNTDRLSTHFDSHQTLVDILYQRFRNPTKSFVDNKLRSISLLRELPMDRSCADAWIPEHYCACYAMNPINIKSDAQLPILTDHFVSVLNAKFKDFPQCARLELNRIHDARQIIHGLQHSETENTGISLFQFFQPEHQADKRYFVVIETKPGFGIFEATLTYSSASTVELIGEPARVNKYGNQSSCVDQKLLKPYCFCEL